MNVFILRILRRELLIFFISSFSFEIVPKYMQQMVTLLYGNFNLAPNSDIHLIRKRILNFEQFFHCQVSCTHNSKAGRWDTLLSLRSTSLEVIRSQKLFAIKVCVSEGHTKQGH